MLLFLHHWDFCWKCEFDTDVKKENHYHYAGKQAGFIISKDTKQKKDVFVIFVLQETENYNLFDKNYVLKITLNGIFNVKTVDLDES